MKDYKKRQILYGVCCLLFLAGVVIGGLVSVRNGEELIVSEIFSDGGNIFLTILDNIKYPFLSLATGFLGLKFVLFYLIVLKGFFVGFTTLSVADGGIIKRILITLTYIPPELLCVFFLIFNAVYFSSITTINTSARGYKGELRRRRTEIIILIISAIIVAILSILWKNLVSYKFFSLISQ